MSVRSIGPRSSIGRGTKRTVRMAVRIRPWAILLACLILTGCTFLRDLPDIAPPHPCRDCLALPSPEEINTCLSACTAPRATPTNSPEIPDSSTPTATVTNTATVAPTASPTSAPAIETAVPVGGICAGPENKYGPFKDDVEAAVRGWLDANADKWRPAGLGGVEFRLRDAATADEFVFAVVRSLRSLGKYDVVAEATGGTPRVAMSPKGDATFHAGYALVVGGSWDVRFPSRGSSYLGQCRPRGFQLFENSGELPTPTVAPTTAPVAHACLPLLTIDVFPLLQDGRPVTYPAQGGGLCRIYNLTPRFLKDGKNVPCNVEHNNCGDAGTVYPFAGDACEPTFDRVSAVFTSASGPSWATKDYVGRVCGPVGSPWSIVVDLKADAVDKAGRPVDRSKFYVFTLQGGI
jgi:hypothetical protein